MFSEIELLRSDIMDRLVDYAEEGHELKTHAEKDP